MYISNRFPVDKEGDAHISISKIKGLLLHVADKYKYNTTQNRKQKYRFTT